MARNAINVLVGASLGPLQKGLKKGVGLVKGFSSQASKIVAGGGGIGGAITGALGGITVAAGIKIALDRFKEIETSTTKLKLSLKAGGDAAGVSAMQVAGFAKNLQAQTGISVAMTTDAAAAIAKVQNIKGPNFTEAIKQSANFAAVMGGDVVSASNQVAAALKNPREGYLDLAAAGVQFSDAQIDSIQSMQAAGDIAGAQGVILEALKMQYDGAAEAAGNTLTGSIDKLWGSMGNLAALVGETLAPYIKAAVGYMTEWVAALDTAGTKNAIIEQTAKAVGWVVDGVQVLGIAWQAMQTVVDAFLAMATTGFKLLVRGVYDIVKAMSELGLASEQTAESIGGFLNDVQRFEDGAYKAIDADAEKLVKAWEKPWESTKTQGFFQEVRAEVKKTAAEAEKMGTATASKPVAAMKQLSAEAIEAQRAATGMVKDLKHQMETFGLENYDAQAKTLERKGATGGQVAEVRKLGAQLKGKELAQSLETPFEKFQREMKKLEQLAADGGIEGDALARAKGKLTADLQASLPENKIQAGGAIMQGSQEARSALLSYQNASRNADPAVALQKQAEIQSDQLKQQTKYLEKIAESKPQGVSFAGL